MKKSGKIRSSANKRETSEKLPCAENDLGDCDGAVCIQQYALLIWSQHIAVHLNGSATITKDSCVI